MARLGSTGLTRVTRTRAPAIGTRERPGAWPGIDGRLFSGRALGEGVVDLQGVTQRLRELNYTGTISVEYEGLDDPWEAVSRGIGYARTLL